MRYFSSPSETGLSVGKEDEEGYPIPESPIDRACWLLYRLGSLCRQSEIELNRVKALRIRYHSELLSQESSLRLN